MLCPTGSFKLISAFAGIRDMSIDSTCWTCFSPKADSALTIDLCSLFPLPRQTSSTSLHTSLLPPIPSIYVPGNHDLGLHLPSASLATYGRERFTESFGPTMGQKEWGGWDVVWIDSMALLEDGGEAVQARAWIEQAGKRESLCLYADRH